MAILDILHYPDERLHLKASKVENFDANLSKIIDDMFETMYDSNGIGLAAIQVDIQKRIVVMDLSKKDYPMEKILLINPQIIEKNGTTEYEEGCLSVPGVYEKITRYETVTIEYQDISGNILTRECDELLSICVQHELDHLDGKVFVDYLSPLKQNFIKKKMKKLDRDR